MDEMAQTLGRWWVIKTLIGFGLLGQGVVFSDVTIAQIVPDNTMGTDSSRVVPDANLRGQAGDRIDGGALRGANLFHSFSEFNVNDGQRVYFSNPVGVANILSRVTGTNFSNILGLLGVDGSANLFLLNPNGIVFGPNARLDVAGSLVVSAGDRFTFPNGSEFSATDPQAPPLLTMNVPVGLQYGTRPGTIVNQGNLSTGQDLTLWGGNLTLQGQLQAGQNLTLQAQDTIQIRDSLTQPFIASAGNQLLVQGNQSVDIFALSHSNSGLFAGGDLILRSQNPVGGDAHYWSGGNFRIEQLNNQPGSWLSPYDPIIRASGDVTFDSYTGASLHILAGGSVTVTGDITITDADPLDALQETVTLSDGTTVVEIDGTATPTLDIRAGTTAVGTIGITGNPLGFGASVPVTNNPATSADITIGGNVTNPSGTVFLTNQYQPNSLTSPGGISITSIDTQGNPGDGGDVIIDSRSTVSLASGGSIVTSATDSGAGGDITVLAVDSVTLNSGAGFDASSFDINDPGSITIRAGDLLLIENSYISTDGSNFGSAGFIDIITTGSLSLAGESYISTDAFGEGDAGFIDITATGSLSLAGGSYISTDTFGNGDAGLIDIAVKSLSLTGGSYISTDTFGSGSAGIIDITATGSLSLAGESYISIDTFGNGVEGLIDIKVSSLLLTDGSFITADTFNDGTGGLIDIEVNSLSLAGGSVIRADTSGEGKAGDITINASDRVLLSSGSSIFSNTGFEGDGGDIFIHAGSLSLTGESSLGANSFVSSGNAGSINIKVNSLSLADGSFINADTNSAGNAGDVTIDASNQILIDRAFISSDTFSSEGGNAGFITITTTGLLSLTGSYISTDTFGNGDGGSIGIEVSSLSLTEESFISSDTYDQGVAGYIAINANDRISLDNAAISSDIVSGQGEGGDIFIATGLLSLTGESSLTTDTSGVGDAGYIEITVNSLLLTEESFISSDTSNQGNAGFITIAAEDRVLLDNAFIFSDVNDTGIGQSGTIFLDTNSLVLTNGAIISSTIFGRGDVNQVGAVAVNAQEISLDNSSIETSVTLGGSGRGGDIFVEVDSLKLSEGARLDANAEGSDAFAGSITVTANAMQLLDGSSIEAETEAGTGGEIALEGLELLLLRNASFISARARGSANGGNVDIEATRGFVVAVLSENSDIIANASFGNGGNINILTQGVFGLIETNSLDPRNNPISEINASSEFSLNGSINIETLDVDPSQGLVELPADLVDPSNLVAQGCGVGGTGAIAQQRRSEFVISGRGGLPTNPKDALSPGGTAIPWVIRPVETRQSGNDATIDPTVANNEMSPEIVEAQGWTIAANGEVSLITNATTSAPQPPTTSPTCPANDHE
jgi:filamentous hemagglutinin family protein